MVRGVAMNIIDIILKQKNGIELSDSEIEYLINGYTQGIIPDYQMSAYLMALCFTGASDKVISKMTMCMANSGDILDLSRIRGTVVDKHSTGGVGDKTTLVVGPCVAACGGKVAKMSGRGLGYTGGTIDKLESIKNFNTHIPIERFVDIINKIGISIVGQMKNLAPADKKIYSLRDVTGTVDCIPLIASSIMSKKIASGANAIVLDVKYGSGAFMKTYKDAKELAETMIKIGNQNGKNVKALLTDMNEPIGNTVGNSLEVIEAIQTLKGNGSKDFLNLCMDISSAMLQFEFVEKSEAECRKMALDSIENGSALNKFRDLVSMQDGDAECIDDTNKFPKSKYTLEVKANMSGQITGMDSEKIGKAACLLGAGRQSLNDNINHSAGIFVNKKTNSFISRNDVLAVLYTDKKEILDYTKDYYLNSLTIE